MADTKFKKNHKKKGGRAKGVPNRKTQDLIDRAHALGVDPFEILLHFAAGNWEELGYTAKTKTMYTPDGVPYEVDVIGPELRQKSASDACQYLHPKRKAIEFTPDDPLKTQRMIVFKTEWGSAAEQPNDDPVPDS